MRRLKDFRVVLLGGLLLLAGAVGIAEAGWCCRRCAPAPVCCVQYVYINQQQNAPPQVDPSSHKIFAVIIADDNEPRAAFNEAVSRDAAQVALLLSHLPLNMVGQIKHITGKDVKKDLILNTIRSMPVGPRDTFFIYYNGHGKQVEESDEQRRNDGQLGQYFDLNLNKNDVASERLYRKEVIDAMQAQKCLFHVLISDTCFKAAKEEAGPSTIGPPTLFKGVQEEVSPDVRNIEIIQTLFLKNKGFVNINSCKPEELAVADVFTPIMVTKAKKWEETAEQTWSNYFEAIKKETMEKGKNYFKSESEEEPLGKDKKGKRQDTQTPFSFTSLSESVEPVTEDDLRVPTAPGETPADSEGPADIPDENTKNGTDQDTATGPAPATLRVQLPADAKLFVDDTLTRQTSAVRTFQTPVLPEGTDYQYTLRAELALEGGTATVKRQVWVRAGHLTPVDLSDPELFRPAAPAIAATPPSAAPSTAPAPTLTAGR
jgi:uncharacterized protein (TIGR03000 family)